MARGWESKSVEDQVEQRAARRAEARERPALSAEERELAARLDALKLARARTLTQLETATAQAHRELLRRTLRALEAQIEELGVVNSES